MEQPVKSYACCVCAVWPAPNSSLPAHLGTAPAFSHTFRFPHSRFQKAHDILFGPGLSVNSRFGGENDDQGAALLRKIIEVYQASASVLSRHAV